MHFCVFFLVLTAVAQTVHGFDFHDVKNLLNDKFKPLKDAAKKHIDNVMAQGTEKMEAYTLDAVSDLIRRDIVVHSGASDLKGAPTCQLSATESCPISSLPKDTTTVILTDKSIDGSQCIFGTPYGFQVIPGSSDNVLFYFQGGGACWNKATTAAGLCTSEISPNAPTGIFDRDNKKNPFKDYTIVHALYCSGDVWVGKTTAPYEHKSKPVTQVGYINADVTKNWLQQQVKSGDIASLLNNFVVMGCSAGSVGTQFWADTLLTAFPAQHAAVIPDSYAGVFPDGTIGPLMAQFGVCETGLVPAALQSSCESGNLDISDVVNTMIAKYPQYPFAFIQSKIDAVQQSFYVAMGLTSKNASAIITPAKFYQGVNGIFGKYNTNNANFLTYLVDGPMHCFTPMNIMYDTTSDGPYGKRNKKGKDMSLVEWLSAFPLSSGQKQSTQCAGAVQSVSEIEMGVSNEIEDSVKGYLKNLWESAKKSIEYKHDRDHDHDHKDHHKDKEGYEISHEKDKTKYCADTVFPKEFSQSQLN
jgi:hypothetical protein